MTDPLSPEQRHRCMASIRSTDTRPERLVRRFLFACGMRFRINVRKLPGTPDIVMRKYRTVIFVNGCFWHGHEGCKFFRMPRTNTPFWENKIQRNKERDKQNMQKLKGKGWNVITIWECELKKAACEQTLTNLYINLQHALISRFSPVTYTMRTETADTPMAAEKSVRYGKRFKKVQERDTLP